MKIKIIYDLGKITDWLTSIGTIGAVIISLYLARRDSNYNAKLNFDDNTYIFGENADFKINAISFSIKNKSKFPMKVKEFGFIKPSKLKQILPVWMYKSLKGTRMFLLPDKELVKLSNYPLTIEPFDSESMYFIKDRVYKHIPEYLEIEGNQFKGLAYAKDSLGNFYYYKVKLNINKEKS